MSKTVFSTVMYCFGALVEADLFRLDELHYVIPILQVTLHFEDNETEIR